jgi:hypothetical protein
MTEKLTLPELIRRLEFELRNTPLIWGPHAVKIEDDKTIVLSVSATPSHRNAAARNRALVRRLIKREKQIGRRS